MSPQRLGLSLLPACLLTVGITVACGEDESPARLTGSGGAEQSSGGSAGGGTGGSDGGTGAAGEPGTAGAAGGQGTAGAAGGVAPGTGGVGGGAGAGPDGPPVTCGNGEVDGAEECDGQEFASGVNCLAFGFDDGALTCNEDCSANTDGCSGAESCYDGRDNDGDSLVDCQDDDDCATECADPCAGVPELADPGSVTGFTSGSANLSDASCGEDASGPELVYEVSVNTTGRLDLELSTHQLLTLSARTACGGVGTELGCSYERLSLPVTSGDTLFVVVDGMSEVDSGEFTLTAASRSADVCGDGFLDPDEECEDENTDPGDGCDASCQLETTESEPNDTVGTADPLQDPYYGFISPAGDVDVIAVEVTAEPASMRVNAYNVGIGMCGLLMMDSYLEVLDTDQAGNGVVASNDDGGDGLCARVSTFALPIGTYYVVVRASDSALTETSTFPYLLGVTVDQCGNGVVAAGEECDDGNLEISDGCSPVCRLE